MKRLIVAAVIGAVLVVGVYEGGRALARWRDGEHTHRWTRWNTRADMGTIRECPVEWRRCRVCGHSQWRLCSVGGDISSIIRR